MSVRLWTLRRHALAVARVLAAVAGVTLAVVGLVRLFSTDNSAGASAESIVRR